MFSVTQLARRAGLARSTLLYYEKKGLLKGRRRANGYRVYDARDAQRLLLIRHLLAGGLTLSECRDCLEARLDPAVVAARVATLDAEIARRKAARAVLAAFTDDGGGQRVRRDWHMALERIAPQAHHDWLCRQGLNERDALSLRWLSRDMNEHESYMADFDLIFSGLARHGPGVEEDTRRAVRALPETPADVLDIGCGTGASTLVLAEAFPEARITALDNSAASLATLMSRVAAAGASARVTTCCASMVSLPFADAAFDLLWSEGSAYIMGFDEALRAWRRVLRPGGHLVLSELVWSRPDVPAQLREFWSAEYPGMRDLGAVLEAATLAGYRVRAHFAVSDAAWLAYIEPLAQRIEVLAEVLAGSRALADIRHELTLLRRYAEGFDYCMLVLEKPRSG